jgi:hypothetical protein
VRAAGGAADKYALKPTAMPEIPARGMYELKSEHLRAKITN